jgi:hypothetical protein
MDVIRPSTKLLSVNVHKLKALECPRKYYWLFVRNLESKYIKVYYWYGSVLGEGWECMLRGASDRQVQDAMDRVDKKFRDRYEVGPVAADEMRLQRQIIDKVLAGAKLHSMYKDLRLNDSQAKFSVQLRDSPVKFVGTKDGDGTYQDTLVLLENKCIIAGMVNDQLFKALAMDMQVNGYVYADRLSGGNYATSCAYCVFKKTQKRVKKRQTEDEFVKEISEDIIQRPSMYYDWRVFRIGRTAVTETGEDIERKALELWDKYEVLGEEVLDPHCWPRETSVCGKFAGCEFLRLCSEPARASVYQQDFVEREMRYDEERKELSTNE